MHLYFLVKTHFNHHDHLPKCQQYSPDKKYRRRKLWGKITGETIRENPNFEKFNFGKIWKKKIEWVFKCVFVAKA